MSGFSRRMFLGLADEATSLPAARIGAGCLTFHSIACESCADACDARAIHFIRAYAIKRPVIDAERCTGCGECQRVCPAAAIVVKEEHV